MFMSNIIFAFFYHFWIIDYYWRGLWDGLNKRDFNSSFDRTPSLFKSAAANESLSFEAYSLVSFLAKCPADAAAINSLKSSLPSLLMSTEFKNESTSISFPRLDKRVFNSSLDKNPSLFTSAAENSSYNFAAYSLDSFFEKCLSGK